MQAIAATLLFWGPEFLRRVHGLNIKDASTVLGLSSIFITLTSTLSGPVLTRFLYRRGRADAVVVLAAAGALAGGPLVLLSILQPNAIFFVILQTVAIVVLTGGATNVLFALQDLAPSGIRATLVSLLFTCFNLFGLGLGPPLAGLISDRLSIGGERLAVALAVQTVVLAGAALALVLWSRKGLLNVEKSGTGFAPSTAPI